MRLTIAIAMLAMIASTACAQSGSSTRSAVAAPAVEGVITEAPSSVVSGDTFGAAPIYSEGSPVYSEVAPVYSEGTVVDGGQYAAPAADCGCSGGGAIASAPVESYSAPAPIVSGEPCGCGGGAPAPAPVDPCCPQRRRGFFRSLFGN